MSGLVWRRAFRCESGKGGGVVFPTNLSFSWLFYNAAAPADVNSATVSNSGEGGGGEA